MNRFALVVSGALLACGESGRAVPGTPVNALGVYEAAVQHIAPRQGSTGVAVLRDSTLDLTTHRRFPTAAAWAWAVDAAPVEYQAAMRALLASTAPAGSMPRALRLPEPLGWISGPQANDSLRQWHFSNVGIGADSTRAAVYVSSICGPLCGGGSFHFYRRDSAGIWHSEGALPVESS